jgi:O-antigen ligase
MLITGVVGLLMSRSLGATAAAVVALGIYGVQSVHARRSTRPSQQLLVPTRLLLLVLVGLAIAIALRPTNLPTSSGFGGSTTAHRTVLADAGIELFQEQPVLGVGWQRSSDEIGSPTVSSALNERFGAWVNPDFIPTTGKTAEVHNGYIQVLAEAGLVGFGLLLAVFFIMGRGIARLLRVLRTEPRLYVSARAATIVLVVILVWWNDNALFGMQPESVLAATCLGILAAIPVVAADNRVEQATKVRD